MRLGTTSLSVTKPGPRRRRYLGTYVLSSASSVNEGDTLTVTVNTIGVPSGTVLYWQTTNITTSDSDFTATSGSVQIVNGAGGFTIAAVADSTTEGAETFGITLRRYSQAGPIVASTTNKTINDTSLSPSYSASSPSSVNEGSALVCTVTTTNVADSTTLYWTTSHTSTTDADFTANSGSFTITSNSGTFNVTPTADATTEGAETFTVQIRTGSVSGTIVATLPSITVNDTSLSGWEINTATYDSVSNHSGGFGNNASFNISGDGTRIYFARRLYTSGSWRTRWYQWTLATPWDVTSTATFNGSNVVGIDAGHGMGWKSDGTRFYRCYNTGRIRQWTIPSNDPWNMMNSSKTYNGEVNLSSYGDPKDIQWSADGTKCFVFFNSPTQHIRLFTVSTAWDITSTVTYVSSSPTLSNRRDMEMKPDGTKVYMTDTSTATFYQYDLTTAFDPTTISTTPTYTKAISSQTGGGTLHGVRFKSDGTELVTYSTWYAQMYKYTM